MRFVGIVGCPHRGAPTERGIIAFDKSTVGRRGRRPLHRQRSLCLLEFYHDKIHRLRRGISSSQKISGTTLIFREPYIFAHIAFCVPFSIFHFPFSFLIIYSSTQSNKRQL